MSVANIGYLYYKEYYEESFVKYSDVNKKEYFKEKNDKIIMFSKMNNLEHISNYINNLGDGFKLKTIYPGLLIGSGYNHIIGQEEEFKLGLEFDYLTGLPIINGSSLKGLLRSYFYNENEKLLNGKLLNEKRKYIKSLIKELRPDSSCVEFDSLDYFERLTYEIFEGKYLMEDNKKKSSYQNLPIQYRDVFYGAEVDIEETVKCIGKDGSLLGDDFITPHENLKNPKPLKFLKVMPNVVWSFKFDLKDKYIIKVNETYKEYNKVLSNHEKCQLFKRILIDFGIGAKTNVGYGQLIEKHI